MHVHIAKNLMVALAVAAGAIFAADDFEIEWDNPIDLGSGGYARIHRLADGNADSRVYAYEVEVSGNDGTQKLLKAVYATGCNFGIGHEPNGGVTTFEIPKSELPHSESLTIVVKPLTSLGTAGSPITLIIHSSK